MNSEQRILNERAERLAERKSVETKADNGEAILVFKMGEERFALRMKMVLTIVPFVKVTPVALTAPEVLGVMANKGEVHSVYDLAKLLQLPAATQQQAGGGQILVLRGDKHRAGVRVDSIEAIDFLETNMEPSRTSRTYVKPRNSEPLILIESLDIFANVPSDGE